MGIRRVREVHRRERRPTIDEGAVAAVRRRAGRPLVTVFGSSAPAGGGAGYEQARLTGLLLAQAGYGVANGGYGGVMAGSAQGAREAGGVAIGVTIAGEPWEPNPWLTENVPVSGALERLLTLVALGSGYVVLPGGTGTLLELAYVWEAVNKGWLGPRPLVLVGEGWSNVAGEIIREQPAAARSVTMVFDVARIVPALRAATCGSGRQP